MYKMNDEEKPIHLPTSPARTERDLPALRRSPDANNRLHTHASGAPHRKRGWSDGATSSQPPPLLPLHSLPLPSPPRPTPTPQRDVTLPPNTSTALDLRTKQPQSALNSLIAQHLLSSLPAERQQRAGSAAELVMHSQPMFDHVKRARSSDAIFSTNSWHSPVHPHKTERDESKPAANDVTNNPTSSRTTISPATSSPSSSTRRDDVIVLDDEPLTSPCNPSSGDDAHRYPTKKSSIFGRFGAGEVRAGANSHCTTTSDACRARGHDDSQSQRCRSRLESTIHAVLNESTVDASRPCSSSQERLTSSCNPHSAGTMPNHSPCDVTAVSRVVTPLFKRVRERLREVSGRIDADDFRMLLFVAGV